MKQMIKAYRIQKATDTAMAPLEGPDAVIAGLKKMKPSRRNKTNRNKKKK